MPPPIPSAVLESIAVSSIVGSPTISIAPPSAPAEFSLKVLPLIRPFSVLANIAPPNPGPASYW